MLGNRASFACFNAREPGAGRSTERVEGGEVSGKELS